eukprot:8891912-Pyramimonas_sp.AAC.1
MENLNQIARHWQFDVLLHESKGKTVPLEQVLDHSGAYALIPQRLLVSFYGSPYKNTSHQYQNSNKGPWGGECILAVIGTGGLVKRSDIINSKMNMNSNININININRVVPAPTAARVCTSPRGAEYALVEYGVRPARPAVRRTAAAA